MAESHWRTLVDGSKYADRMPIGLEHVIRGADGECVRGLYRRLYQLGKMAAVVVGDFQSTDEVLAMLEVRRYAPQRSLCQASTRAPTTPSPANVPGPDRCAGRIWERGRHARPATRDAACTALPR